MGGTIWPQVTQINLNGLFWFPCAGDREPDRAASASKSFAQSKIRRKLLRKSTKHICFGPVIQHCLVRTLPCLTLREQT
jgi:hypothetical protein